jgi:hypothetical protein
MTDQYARSSARREIRPYKGLEEIQNLFDHLVLSWGETEIESGGYANISEAEYLNAGVTLQLMVSAEDDSEPLPFVKQFEELLPDTGMSLADIQFQVVARSPYLKLIEVLWRGEIADLRDEDQQVRLTIAGKARPGPFQAWSSGCSITFSASLKKARNRRALEPSRKGTWLGRSEFSIDTDTGEIGFTPMHLTAEIRAQKDLGKNAIRYVEIQSAIDPEVDDSNIEVYVDEELLNLCVSNPSSSGSRSFQHQILLWALEAIVWKASRQLNDDGLPDLDEINGSFIEKVIAWAAGGSQATSATKERFLLDVKDNPQRFMSHVESSISNLQSEIGQTMKGAS